MTNAIAGKFDVDRDRSRDRRTVEPGGIVYGDIGERVRGWSPTKWIDQVAGRRYLNCRLDNYQATSDGQAKAVQACRDYVTSFGECLREGVSLVFIGPKGTGKDHLMIATIRAICLGYPNSNLGSRAIYRDGLSLFSEFRSTINNRSSSEEGLIDILCSPDLLALSDPVPPVGGLSEYEKRMLLRVVDRRYRDCKPIAATLNVSNRVELEDRMGPQAADRLLDSAVVVKCNWESFRQRKGV